MERVRANMAGRVVVAIGGTITLRLSKSPDRFKLELRTGTRPKRRLQASETSPPVSRTRPCCPTTRRPARLGR